MVQLAVRVAKNSRLISCRGGPGHLGRGLVQMGGFRDCGRHRDVAGPLSLAVSRRRAGGFFRFWFVKGRSGLRFSGEGGRIPMRPGVDGDAWGGGPGSWRGMRLRRRPSSPISNPWDG